MSCKLTWCAQGARDKLQEATLSLSAGPVHHTVDYAPFIQSQLASRN